MDDRLSLPSMSNQRILPPKGNQLTLPLRTRPLSSSSIPPTHSESSSSNPAGGLANSDTSLGGSAMSRGASGNTDSSHAASSTSPRNLNEESDVTMVVPTSSNRDTAPANTSTIAPNNSNDDAPSETSSVSVKDFADDSSPVETSTTARNDHVVRASLTCPGIWKGEASSCPINSRGSSNFNVSPIEPLSSLNGDEEIFKIDPRKVTHDDVNEVPSMAPRKLDGDELFFTISWATPSDSNEHSPVELSPLSTRASMVSVTIPGDLSEDSAVEVPSISTSTSRKIDTPVESSKISPSTSEDPMALPVEDSPVPPTPSHRLPNDFLETLKKHCAAYIVDEGDAISITWLSCNQINSPETSPTAPDTASNTTTSNSTPNPITINSTFLPASQIMLYDSTSKPLFYFLDPSNEEMEYETWLWVKSELDDYFLTPTSQVTQTTLWSAYNPYHHAHDSDKLPSWALTVVFNYTGDLGCRVVYYPPSIRDSKGFWDFSGLDGENGGGEELVTPDIVKEAVEMLVVPFYFGPFGAERHF